MTRLSALILLFPILKIDVLVFVIFYHIVLLTHYYWAAFYGWRKIVPTDNRKKIFLTRFVALTVLSFSLYFINSDIIVYFFGIHFAFSEVYGDSDAAKSTSIERGIRLVFHFSCYALLLRQDFQFVRPEFIAFIAILLFSVSILARTRRAPFSIASIAMDFGPLIVSLMLWQNQVALDLAHVVFYHILHWLFLVLIRDPRGFGSRQLASALLVGIPMILLIPSDLAEQKNYVHYLYEFAIFFGFFHIIAGMSLTSLQPRLINWLLLTTVRSKS